MFSLHNNRTSATQKLLTDHVWTTLRPRFLYAQLRSRHCKQGSFAITRYRAISHFCHFYFENSKFHIMTQNRFKVNLMSFLFSHMYALNEVENLSSAFNCRLIYWRIKIKKGWTASKSSTTKTCEKACTFILILRKYLKQRTCWTVIDLFLWKWKLKRPSTLF